MVHLYFIWFMMKQSLHYCLSCYSSSIHYERERERERVHPVGLIDVEVTCKDEGMSEMDL